MNIKESELLKDIQSLTTDDLYKLNKFINLKGSLTECDLYFAKTNIGLHIQTKGVYQQFIIGKITKEKLLTLIDEFPLQKSDFNIELISTAGYVFNIYLFDYLKKNELLTPEEYRIYKRCDKIDKIIND